MPIISAPQEYNEESLYVDLRTAFGRSLYLKCEGFNFSGSVKLKAAAEMISSAERRGVLRPGATLVESSSGNLGVALSMIAADRGYGFVCVTDARCNDATRHMMEAFGAQVHVITEPAADGGFLGARISHVRALCAADSRFVWLNQYRNPDNWMAHYLHTAPSVAAQFPDLDVLFVGAGTTGTLMGCARYFRDSGRTTRIVAVDVIGSVTFGCAPGRRLIPGLGTSVRPAILDESFVDEVVHVSEPDAVRRCRELAARGFLFGGSTGTVLSGALSWLAGNAPGDSLTAVAIAPDLGERYLETVYNDEWVDEAYWPEAAYREGPAPLPEPLSELNATY
ncbi:2,3-diaminopropionate biosynthesis protein SbnA [Amycolatopsis minnesotensis]|uniref:2,3-diaminopropionate biosynthesis protein SbnA n=1 Tax=Amycolatopsis minnesotensis TaxID=337894 RepID=A0ABN2PZN7_9PSEU